MQGESGDLYFFNRYNYYNTQFKINEILEKDAIKGIAVINISDVRNLD